MRPITALLASCVLTLGACADKAATNAPEAAPASGSVADAFAVAPPGAGPVASVDPAHDACGASDHTDLVGQPLAAVTLPRAPGDRVVGPRTAVTDDFRPDRLNVHIDEDGAITELLCG